MNMDYVIQYKSGKCASYFDRWTGIGPKFGATKAAAHGYATKVGALDAIARMPLPAAVNCSVQKRTSRKKS